MALQGFSSSFLRSLDNYPLPPPTARTQHLGGDWTPKLQQMIDAWAIKELQISYFQNSVLEVKKGLVSFLVNPEKRDLVLNEICLDGLYPILNQQPFKDRLETLSLSQCSMSEDCNTLNGFLAKMNQFPNLKDLHVNECEITEFPQEFLECRNLKKLEFTECGVIESFDPIQTILDFENLTFLQTNRIKISLPDSIRQGLNQTRSIIQKLYKDDFFKRNFYSYLSLMKQDPEFYRAFFAIVNPEGVEWDEAQYALSISLVEQAALLMRTHRQGIAYYAECLINTVWPLELLRDFTERKAWQDGAVNPYEPIQTYMAFLGNLRDLFNERIEYFPTTLASSSTPLNEVDLQTAQHYIESQLSSQEAACLFLIKKPEWVDYLRREFPVEYNIANTEGALTLCSCLIDLTKLVLDQLPSKKDQSVVFSHTKRWREEQSFAGPSSAKRHHREI